MQRRLLSILLFWATLFPLIAPALTSGAMGQSTLPACCRRGGKHHCDMSPEARALLLHEDDGSTRIGAKPEQCPYRQRSLAATHLQTPHPRRRFNPGSILAAGALRSSASRVPAPYLLRSLPPETRPSLSPRLALARVSVTPAATRR